MLIKNTLESSLKSFNDFVPYNMNLLMQQRLPPFVQHQSTPIPQPPPPTPTTVVQPHPEVLAQMIPASEVAIPIDHVLVPLPSPPKSPPPITQPPSTEGWQWWPNHFLYLFGPASFDNDKGGKSRIGILIFKSLYSSASFNKTSVLVVTYMCFHVF